MRLCKEKRMYYQAKLKEYMEHYGHLYSEGAREEIECCFLSRFSKIRYSSDVLNQLYELFGVFEENKDNTYDIFIDNMVKRMDINRKLLEVGCGYYPSLAVRIASMQKSGSVTAVDPKVVTDNVDGITVIKEFFSTSLGLEYFDMFYGLYPCEATIEMIILANIFDKDLCLMACDCGHTPFGELDDMCEWLKYVESLLKQSIPNGRDFDIEHISSLDAPLITTRKLKI